jgi:hypothetical protein
MGVKSRVCARALAARNPARRLEQRQRRIARDPAFQRRAPAGCWRKMSNVSPVFDPATVAQP